MTDDPIPARTPRQRQPRKPRRTPFQQTVELMCNLGLKDFLELEKTMRNYKRHLLKTLREGDDK